MTNLLKPLRAIGMLVLMAVAFMAAVLFSGSAATAAPVQETISGLSVVAATNWEAAANIVDGDPDSYWSNGGNASVGEFEINLGGVYQVDEIWYQDDWNRPLRITLDGMIIFDGWTEGASENSYAAITPTVVTVGSALRFELTDGQWLVPEEIQISGRRADESAQRPVLPANVGFDYQIGSDYDPQFNVGIVSRDWFAGSAIPGAFNICYVNAFQTQPDNDSFDRPDELSNWPQNLVLANLGDDPNWGGEYLIDITTSTQRAQAVGWVRQMVQTCKDKGFQAVEYDNLDSWTRFEQTAVANQVTFGRSEAIDYASALTDAAHSLGLSVAQKNTSDLTRTEAVDIIGFDFAVVEECGTYNECEAYTAIYGNRVVAVEYTDAGFAYACSRVGGEISVIKRDRDVTAPGSSTYVYSQC